jgi:hypothetical protein
MKAVAAHGLRLTLAAVEECRQREAAENCLLDIMDCFSPISTAPRNLKSAATSGL